MSVASAPTVIPDTGLSTRNNSVATGQTNFTTTSAPAFGSHRPPTGDARRRSSLTHALWLHSLPLPAFGQQPSTTTEPPTEPGTQRDDPLAPLNLSDSDAHHLPLDDVISTGILTSGVGQAYIAQTPGPSSAPATPGILHEPSQYIHTHLPRRASLTPANLNLVGPVPPSASVIEQVRRESLALLAPSPGTSPAINSTTFLAPSSGAIPPGMTGSIGNSEQFAQMHWGLRRKSMTPSTPAVASPTKLTATASISRKSAVGSAADMGARSSSAGGRNVEGRRMSTRPATAEGYVVEERRGSIRRARAEEQGETRLDDRSSEIGGVLIRIADSEAAVRAQPLSAAPIPVTTPRDTSFVFGEPVNSGSPSSIIRHSPTNSTIRTTDSSEAAEAERQRIAFMTSTYGSGARGSISGGSRRGSMLRDQLVSAGVSASSEGKRVLLGNEGFRRGSLGIPGFDTSGLTTGLSTSASTTASGALPFALGAQIGGGSGAASAASSHDDRRGSVPIAIPWRTPSSASEHIPESEDENVSFAFCLHTIANNVTAGG